jgi:hypothetical protein
MNFIKALFSVMATVASNISRKIGRALRFWYSLLLVAVEACDVCCRTVAFMCPSVGKKEKYRERLPIECVAMETKSD